MSTMCDLQYDSTECLQKENQRLREQVKSLNDLLSSIYSSKWCLSSVVMYRTSESAILKQYVAEREKARVLCSEIDKKDAVIRVLKLHLRKDRVGID